MSPRSNKSRYLEKGGKRIHIDVAERAFGRPLPRGAQVHHVDENTHNNVPSNLVICQDGAYHKLLHRRRRILKRGGDPNSQRWCCDCKRLRLISEMGRSGRREGIANQCKDCLRIKTNRWYHRKHPAAGYAVANENGLL